MRMLAKAACILWMTALCAAASAAPPNLADGFASLPKGAKVVVMPVDIELFSISAGGVVEPRADWTEAAARHFKAALLKKQPALGINAVDISEKQADELVDVNTLHAAIARSIAFHHFGISSMHLPTKDGKLDWSLGEAAQMVKKSTGADYAIFSWVRDGYASAERKAAMVAMALFGVGLGGGQQTAYASLVDLSTGRVLWFNRLQRGSGDLREEDTAAETLDTLLENFPAAK